MATRAVLALARQVSNLRASSRSGIAGAAASPKYFSAMAASFRRDGERSRIPSSQWERGCPLYLGPGSGVGAGGAAQPARRRASAGKKALLLLVLLAIPPSALGGCSLVANQAPPEWGYFDVVTRPGGGIPASLGYYAGAFAWSPVGLVLGGLLPYPADEAVALYPGHWLGTGVGLAFGAPFHLIALPFGASGPAEEKGPGSPAEPTPRPK